MASFSAEPSDLRRGYMERLKDKTAVITGAGSGIGSARVNCICSGGILTALTAPLTGVRRQLTAVTPLRRLGTPEEVAYLALFLASEESSYVNGASIVID